MSSATRRSILRASALMASRNHGVAHPRLYRNAMLIATAVGLPPEAAVTFQTANTLPTPCSTCLPQLRRSASSQIVGAVKTRRNGSNRLLTLAGWSCSSSPSSRWCSRLLVITAAGHRGHP